MNATEIQNSEKALLHAKLCGSLATECDDCRHRIFNLTNCAVENKTILSEPVRIDGPAQDTEGVKHYEHLTPQYRVYPRIGRHCFYFQKK